MKNLSVDIESYSSNNLAKSGVYRYAEASDFEILLFGYAIDDEAVQVVDLASGEKLPDEIVDAIMNPDVIKWAFNAQFERICLSRHFGMQLSPDSWRCTMVWSATLGLPLSLEGVGKVLKLEKQKMSEGKALIRYFCMPCKPTKVNAGRCRNLPNDAPDKWKIFKEYNKRDVEMECSIKERLAKFPVSETEWENYILDQEINGRGIHVDLDLVAHAVECDSEFGKMATARAYELSGLDNPNSVAQVKGWLSDRGVKVDSLNKKTVQALAKEADGEVLEMLKLRLAMAKTSLKKYESIERSVCEDGRVRGLFQFYGANRTGRFSGRLVQLQNLPQNHLPDLELARKLVKEGRYEDMELLFDSVPGVLSELIRTAFIPTPGCKFMVADFSAVEARVLSWLAGEKWRMEVFATHGKIYEASASAMFHVPIEEITKGSLLRQKGKVAELGLGFNGSVGALKAMGAIEMGVEEAELQGIVDSWRVANPKIVRLWWEMNRAAISAIKERSVRITHGITFRCHSGILFITLPSGRNLAYVKPRIGTNRFGGESITYEGIGLNKKWERLETYGGKLVENCTQAIARDLLTEAMQHVTKKGYDIVMTIHDEIVVETPVEASLDDLCVTMSETPSWAQGLLLHADGYECEFYKKD